MAAFIVNTEQCRCRT